MDTATLILSALMVGSMVADAETTMGRRELNPIMRPFSASRAKLYTVKGGVGIGVSVLSHKLRHSDRKRDRILGWVLPGLFIGVQGAAAVHNSTRR